MPTTYIDRARHILMYIYDVVCTTYCIICSSSSVSLISKIHIAIRCVVVVGRGRVVVVVVGRVVVVVGRRPQLFYYIGPASVAFALRRRRRRRRRPRSGKRRSVDDDDDDENGIILRDDDGDASSRLYGATATAMPLPRQQSDDKSNNSPAAEAEVYDVDATHCDDCEEDEYGDDEYDDEYDDGERSWPSRPMLMKASSIAFFDIFAQSMVYAGNNLAGPTIFSIIYSSVTIWAALYSKILLNRSLSNMQWCGVSLVVLGLSLTALDSSTLGKNVFLGAVLIVVGTSGHGLTYVFSEKIMTTKGGGRNDESTMAPFSSTMRTASSTTSGGTDAADHRNGNGRNAKQQPPRIREESSSRLRLRQRRDHRRWRDDYDRDNIISVRANCAIQGLVATSILFVWQLVYTLPRIHPLILVPMYESGTSPLQALCILFAISLSNLLHSVTFFVTLKHMAGGATSAGVLKGLQAVLVFAASSVLLCGRWDGTGEEMCWSTSKLISLTVVLCGIAMYARGMMKHVGATTTRGEATADDDDGGIMMCV